MIGIFSRLRDSWEKNWPQLLAAVTRGLPGFVLRPSPPDIGSSVPVFCFHVVSRDAFERDLAFLAANGYVTIGSDALVAHLEGQREAPFRAVVLTIDDGASNLYEVAYPLLRHYAMRAVAFVAPAFHRETDGPGAVPGAPRPCMWPEIREMQASGHVDFQAHTLAHRYIPRWPEPVALAGCPEAMSELRRGPPLSLDDDLRRARVLLEEALGKPVKDLAFPKYRGTPAALEAGLAAGYRSFWWGNLPRRPGNLPGQSPHYIPRLNGDLLRRLPGKGRRSLTDIMVNRLRGSPGRLAHGVGSPA